MSFLFVALGGALGAVGRYAFGLIPLDLSFPLKTLIVNFIGSFLIGFLAGIFARFDVAQSLKMFLQVGVCGGFTTFATFSLENYELIAKKCYGQAALYIVCSLASCILGVWLGKTITRIFA